MRFRNEESHLGCGRDGPSSENISILPLAKASAGDYAQLQRASASHQIDEWLDWFSRIALEAQQRTLDRVQFLLAKAKLLYHLRDRINGRQEKALLRMFAEGPDGFRSGLSAANYRTITDAAPARPPGDLAELVELEALRREGGV